MIRIFNVVTKDLIEIEENDSVQLTPKDYQEGNSYIEIQLKGINFPAHTHSCDTCKALINSLNTPTKDWFVEYLGKIRQLDLSIGDDKKQKNVIEFSTGKVLFFSPEGKSLYDFYGSKLILKVSSYDNEELLIKALENEEYEYCAKLRDANNFSNY